MPYEPSIPAAAGDSHARRCAELDRAGYCVVEGALAGARLAAARRRLVAQARAERELHAHRNPANEDARSQWVGMLLNKGAVFRELLAAEPLLALVAHVLGEDFVLSCLDAQIQHPGSGDMPLHTDQWWMPPPQRPGQPPPRPAGIRREHGGGSTDPSPSGQPIAPVACCNVLWLLSDFRAANGATRVVPASHLSGRQPRRDLPHPVATVAVEAPAGSALVFDGRLWHGAGANRTRHPRYAVTMNFCGPQFRALENYTRGLRPEVLADCPPSTLARLGFATWSSYGHTGDPTAAVVADGSEALGELSPGTEEGDAD